MNEWNAHKKAVARAEAKLAEAEAELSALRPVTGDLAARELGRLMQQNLTKGRCVSPGEIMKSLGVGYTETPQARQQVDALMSSCTVAYKNVAGDWDQLILVPTAQEEDDADVSEVP